MAFDTSAPSGRKRKSRLSTGSAESLSTAFRLHPRLLSVAPLGRRLAVCTVVSVPAAIGLILNWTKTRTDEIPPFSGQKSEKYHPANLASLGKTSEIRKFRMCVFRLFRPKVAKRGIQNMRYFACFILRLPNRSKMRQRMPNTRALAA